MGKHNKKMFGGFSMDNKDLPVSNMGETSFTNADSALDSVPHITSDAITESQKSKKDKFINHNQQGNDLGNNNS